MAVARLPVELLSKSFNLLSTDDLLVAQRVCHVWRAVGHDNQTFWRDIELSSTSRGALELFRDRLYHKPHSAVSITVTLQDFSHRDTVVTHVLPLLAQHVVRAEALRVYLHTNVDREVFETLISCAAPQLQTFHLGFVVTDEQHCAATIPTALFARSAPLLRTAWLGGMYLPPESPEAFDAVSTVTLFMDDKIWHTMPLAFLASLPSARNCTIVGGAIFDTPSFPENSYYSALHPLQLLRVSLRGGFPQHVLSSSALDSVPCVETTDVSENTVGVLLSHLDSEISVVIRFDHCEHEDDRDFEAIYTSRTTGRVRKLGAGLAWFQRYYTRCDIACLGLDFPALRHRITTMTIHARLCVLISHHIPALPACSEIILELATAEDLVQLVTSTVSFVLPVLDRAVLRSTAATIHCDPFALLRLVTTTLLRRRDSAVGRLQMELHGVEADDIASDLTLLVDISRTSVGYAP